jgi:SAM-dependent methyltransferase
MQTLQGEQRAQDFDECFGVDTAGYIHPTELTLNHPNQVHAISYGASDPRDVRYAIASLPIDYANFVFVDFGSGKGRAILLASEFPFKRVVGVEFSEELHKIAQDNINHFSRNQSQCANVQSICMDAVDYPLPDADLVCYFCNPFDATLMRQMVAKMRESLLSRPRDVFILYYNAKEGHVFDGADCFERVETSGWIRVWRTALEWKKTKGGALC